MTSEGPGATEVRESRRASAPGDPGTDGDEARDHDDHLADLPDGVGCAKIWEHLSSDRDGEPER